MIVLTIVRSDVCPINKRTGLSYCSGRFIFFRLNPSTCGSRRFSKGKSPGGDAQINVPKTLKHSKFAPQ